MTSTKGRKFPAEPLTPGEVNALLSQCSTRAPTGIRNKALIMVLYRAGLRISEALDLRVADVNPARGTLRVLHGKGNKARTVSIDPGAMAVVQRWIDTRRQLGLRNGTLFCTLAGKPVLSGYVRDMLKRSAGKAGLEKRVHPHGLRHTNAVEMDHERVPLSVISRHLGHSSSAVTARYIDHVSPADVIAMGRSRAWPEPLESSA